MVKNLVFPSYLEKELQEIRLSYGVRHERELLELVVGEGCPEYQFEKFQKNIVDLTTEGVPVNF